LLIKELGVALVFTAGVWGMPCLRHRLDSGRWLGWPVLLLFQYLMLAVVNLLEFSIYESKIDAAHQQSSFVRGIGRRRARAVVLALLSLQIPLAIIACRIDLQRAVFSTEAIFMVMTFGLWIVLAMPRFAARNERYRTIGDGVFLLPLLMAIA